MKQSIRKIVFIASIVVLVLAACAPAEQPPASDPALVADTVGTAVALTVDAQNLQVAMAQAQATETATAIPTSGFVEETLVADTPIPGFTEGPLITDTPRSNPGNLSIQKVTPDKGTIQGGTTVTILGTNLWNAANPNDLPAFEFGKGNYASNVRCSNYSATDSTSTTKCTVTAPKSLNGGPETVIITASLDNSASQPDLQANDQFTYYVPPKTVCNVFAQSPDYLENIKAGAPFDIKWIIVNTGSTTWPAGLDVKYSSGPQMTKETRVEISKALKPNERYTIVLDAVAPKQTGPQYMTWIIEGQLCSPSVIINVVEK